MDGTNGSCVIDSSVDYTQNSCLNLQRLFIHNCCFYSLIASKSLINPLDKNDIIDLSNEVAGYENRIIKKKQI